MQIDKYPILDQSELVTYIPYHERENIDTTKIDYKLNVVMRANRAHMDHLLDIRQNFQKYTDLYTEYSFKKVNLYKILSDVIDGYIAVSHFHKELKLNFNYTSGAENAMIIGDEFWIKKLFVSIFANAVGCSWNQPINTKLLYIKGTIPLWKIIVEHMGIGLETKKVENIIDDKYDCNDRTIESALLGLIISKKIVDKHKGRINMHYSSDFGIRIEITFEMAINELIK